MARNRKAEAMGINTVVVLAIALLILLLLGVFFTGGFSALTGKIRGFAQSSGNTDEAGKRAGCNNICTSWVSEGCIENTPSYTTARLQCNATDYNALKTTCGCTPW